MPSRKLIFAAVLVGLGVGLLPSVLPQGPGPGLDAAKWLASGQFFLGAAVVFLGGLLTALTPCVYPLIPITVSVFGARQAQSRAQAALLTSAYVLGMGVVFSALGVLAAKTGQVFGSALGSPWAAVGLALFLLLLASSMFGAFELAIPSGLLAKFNAVGGAGVGGAFLMGGAAGFLAAPCTGPVLSGLLTFVARARSPALGAGLLFVYALGIGAPFMLIGAFAVRLPKGGRWMEWAKSALGILLVALAASYIKDAFPPARAAIAGLAAQLGRTPGAWIAAALAALGVLAGAVHRSFKAGSREFALKATGLGLVAFALVLRGGALNASEQGRFWVKAGWLRSGADAGLAWDLTLPEKGSTLMSFEQALAQARSMDRPVMIDFSAEWCAACKELDRTVYVQPEVVRESQRFVNIKVDSTHDEDAVVELQQRFGVHGLPTVAFVSRQGDLLPDPRVTGYLPPQEFLALLKKVR